ncbi:hypothetical protein [Paucimonas lemoignei]|uniref:hypothetical protein n=1 Tax=Paucimonas lemoignei TaxID=29443 RepID=UPI00140443C5|nr:hypothetical protein [Paucimonas lemoignei]
MKKWIPEWITILLITAAREITNALILLCHRQTKAVQALQSETDQREMKNAGLMKNGKIRGGLGARHDRVFLYPE